MARSKTQSARPIADPTLQETVQQLAEQVKDLADQVEVLRDAIDEMREEFQWALRNGKLTSHADDELHPVIHSTSIEEETPTWDDERPDAAEPEDAPPPEAAPLPPQVNAATEQGNLF